jgi:hypothetical protein
MRLLPILLVVVLNLIASSSFAASVTLEKDGSLQFVLLSGPLEIGDAERVVDVVRDFAKKNDQLMNIFRLDSAGGNVGEAIRIATLVRGLYGSVKVANGRYCASSCFLIWINGAVRMASGSDVKSDGGRLVVHRPYWDRTTMGDLSSEALGRMQVDAMKAMRAYLEENLVPRTLIDEMLSRPSNDGYILTDRDIRMLGEIPPWFEEVSIAKCGYRRGIVDEILDASDRGRTDEVQRLRSLDDDIIKCQKDLRWDAGAAYLKRLRTGWRPWEPSK